MDDDWLRSSHSVQEHLTPYENNIKIDNRKDLKEFRDQCKEKPKGEIIYDLKEKKQLTGCNMQMPGNMMIIETHFSKEDFENIQEPLYKYFNLIYQVLEQNINLYQTYRQLNATKEILERSQDYSYIVSYNREIIFINNKLRIELNIDRQQQNELKKEQSMFLSRQIDIAFQKKQTIFSEIEFELKNKQKIWTYTTIVPLIQNNVIFAVAVIMQVITYRHVLFKAHQELIRIENIDKFEEELIKHLKQLGFEYVTPYKRINTKTYEFINEENKKLTYTISDDDTHLGRVSIWHRKKFPDKQLLEKWNTRLETTPYKLKEGKYWSKYNDQKTDIDNFWITVPIMYDSKVIKLFRMGWHIDKQWDSEAVYIGKLRLIESFARSVGQIWENISQKIYQTKFQNMISHGIIEPLQIMRSYLEQEVIDQEDKNLREQKFRTADANLEMAQSALLSILSTYVGQTRVKKEYVNINEHLLNLLAFFKAYATERAEIDFIISIPDEPLICYTDPIMLNQIFNNLVGNSIRQLKKIKRHIQKERKISIQIKKCDHHLAFYISDNGQGLSEEVKDYFYETTFITKGMVPTGRLGLGFSKEISEMLGGKLELIEPPALEKGTTFLLSLPFNEEENDTT
ncbi:ATP-binding region, ATPase-like domain protein [Candidatus Magnetomorum sp. HK-1]|nr:ATP-binding region, ATPase-like domain protein [Candidatus Magnetomorum sp. HK-1]